MSKEYKKIEFCIRLKSIVERIKCFEIDHKHIDEIDKLIHELEKSIHELESHYREKE